MSIGSMEQPLAQVVDQLRTTVLAGCVLAIPPTTHDFSTLISIVNRSIYNYTSQQRKEIQKSLIIIEAVLQDETDPELKAQRSRITNILAQFKELNRDTRPSEIRFRCLARL
jgi:hypothetical protein